MSERQIRSKRADPIRSEQVDKIMIVAIRFEHIRDGASRSDQKELRGTIRL